MSNKNEQVEINSRGIGEFSRGGNKGNAPRPQDVDREKGTTNKQEGGGNR